MSKFQNDAIFWVDVDKIDPNPYQPRREFNEEALRNLAESIRQYGVLQPLTVTRNEETKPDGGLKVYYELIAGERRLRAAKLASLSQVPVTIRDQKEDAEVKLELAIIENLQREDLNPIERAEAFDQLAEEFDFTHREIAEKIGKSREYVSNSMRLLKLPEKVKKAVIAGKITEGHTRPIMMLRDNPEKQEQLFKEIIHQDLTVRESEKRARRDAQDKVRKKENKIDPETKALEDELSDTLGTRVQIEKKEKGGKLVIDFFSEDDLQAIVKLMKSEGNEEMGNMMEKYIETIKDHEDDNQKTESENAEKQEKASQATSEQSQSSNENTTDTQQTDDSNKPLAQTLGTVIQEAREKQKQEESEDQPSEDQSDSGSSVKQTHEESTKLDQQTQETQTAHVSSDASQEPETENLQDNPSQSSNQETDQVDTQSVEDGENNKSSEVQEDEAVDQSDQVDKDPESVSTSQKQTAQAANNKQAKKASEDNSGAHDVDETQDEEVQSSSSQTPFADADSREVGTEDTKGNNQETKKDKLQDENSTDDTPDNEDDAIADGDTKNNKEEEDMYSVSNFSI